MKITNVHRTILLSLMIHQELYIVPTALYNAAVVATLRKQKLALRLSDPIGHVNIGIILYCIGNSQ